MTYHQSAKEHLIAFFASHPFVEEKWASGPMAADTEFRVLRFAQGPKCGGMWSYCTIGASRVDDNLLPIEFVLLSPRVDFRVVQLLAMTAHYHRAEKLDLFHMLPIGEPWLAGASCDCLYVSLPYLFGPKLEIMEFDGTQTYYYWLLPITSAERKFARERGPEALEQRFEAAKLDYSDLTRTSVI